MSLAVMPKAETPIEDMQNVLNRACEQLDKCDNLLIVMQKKEGGLLYFAPQTARVDTMSFMATAFVQYIHRLMGDPI